MKLLILNNEIVAQEPFALSDSDIILGSYQVADTDLPADFTTAAYIWDGLALVPRSAPPLAIPTSVSMAQARQQLLALGMLDAVNAAIAGMSQAAQIDWQFRSSVDRVFPLTLQMAQLLGWSELDLDNYFIEADKL